MTVIVPKRYDLALDRDVGVRDDWLVFDSAVLEVAIGLILIYVVLSLICSGLSEGTANALGTREKLLRQYIANILDPTQESGRYLADHFYRHPLLAAIVKPRKRQRRARYPAHIPPGLSAIALMSAFLEPGRTSPSPSIADRIDQLPSEPLQEATSVLLDQAEGDKRTFYRLLTELFEFIDSLVTDEYRRQVRWFLWMWAGVITIAVNIDTVHIAEVLWSETVGSSNQADARLPFGWSSASARAISWHVGDILSKLLGWFLTVGAVTFGAEFWLGLLERLSRVPSSRDDRQDREDDRGRRR